MNDNVTLIPARRRAGNRISKEENKPKLKYLVCLNYSTLSRIADKSSDTI